MRLPVLSALSLGLLLSACWFNSPERLNRRIDEGDAAKALTTIEDKLTSTPDDPALNLLAMKARMALCLQRSCVKESDAGMPPALLAGFGKLASHINGPVSLAEDVSPLTITGVFQSAMQQFQSASSQPASVLALYNAAPAAVQPSIASGLFQPALTLARKGDTTAAASILTRLGKAENLPATYTYAAQMLAAMFTGQEQLRETNLIALRSVTEPRLPDAAAALLPWAMLKDASAVSGTEPALFATAFPTALQSLKVPNLLTPPVMAAVAQEFVTISTTPDIRGLWQPGWPGTPRTFTLALQRTALALDPNQPSLWATYLPALITATTAETSASRVPSSEAPLPASAITSTSAPRIASQVISAAAKLESHPAVATPLVMFASKIPLTKQQQIDLEKLSQTLLIRAAEHGDVTSTLVLAQTLPGVAQNNRQSVVPLLVKYIRGNLRDGNFESATRTADLLTQTLQMDVEFAPLVLEEFGDDLKRRKIPEALAADTPEALLQSPEEATIDLGPLFTFMQSYFEDQPKVITAQLTTLIAEARGTYGQPAAMYRLGSYFPASTLPPEKQRDWLGASLEQALLTDTKLSAIQLVETSAQLAAVHPQLNLSPLLEAAIRRATTLEDQRTLWQSATPQVREVLRTIRPEFTLLMQGIDALTENRLNAAAHAFSGLTEATWLNEATPFIEQFNDRLVGITGIYVPVSAAPALKVAAITLSPAGLQGGKLTTVSVTFVSRVGTATESEPSALRTNAAAAHNFTMPVSYNFDTRSLAISSQAVAQTPNGGTFTANYGTIRNLKLQGDDATDSSILTVTLADGSNIPFTRTLIDPAEPLRPDGTYLIQSRLGTTASSTQNILPPGSMLTFTTGKVLQPAPAEADIPTTQVYPLAGTVRHPAGTQPLQLTGYFEPLTLTSTFTFSYPLPLSAQPARAAVRCQVLAGPITCGAHNMNSARQAYAALVTGLQTRESLATSAGERRALNGAAGSRLLTNAIPVIPSATAPAATSATTRTSGTVSGLVSATLVTSSSSVSVSIAVPSATAPALLAKPNLQDEDAEEGFEEEAPIAATSPTTVVAPAASASSSTEPLPGAFINRSGNASATMVSPPDEDATPGAFINRSGGKSAATSSTRP